MVFNWFFEMKMKYDESDNVFIWVFWVFMDKVIDLLGGLFFKIEMLEVFMEIFWVDLVFDKDWFLK